jgi:hypothetical protein
MRTDISAAASVVCPMCDEKKCVGRYNCKKISDYLKTKLVDFDHVKKVTAVCSVELPVKLGQKLYTIPRSAIREWTVAGVWISTDPKCSYVHVYWEKNGHHMSSIAVNFSDLDRTFFFSREEAELALSGQTKGE